MYLVLTLNKGGEIYIGDDITIKLTHTGRYQSSLAINAPRHIPIVREEVKDRLDPNIPWQDQINSRRIQREWEKQQRIPQSMRNDYEGYSDEI